ncbi:hypothetical protein GCM10007897_42910 [Sphingobium jiangsuense]|nr:hypothetical protein GCM10007897_42910 [Sphingobium jiangsuense]
MTWLRWQLSVAAWWLWLKVTPEHPFKRDIVAGVAALGKQYRSRVNERP